MRLLPRDFMKLGQMMLDGGKWHGRQIVSSAWAERATSALVEIEEHGYGYYWWIEQYPYMGDTLSAFFAGGNGGQIVMGIPELDMVIAFYAGNYSDMVFLTLQREYVPKYILPALIRKQD
jgi:CubicO group peptidase (beta-lactamase class C family)